ncbi:MAG: hypothetical protein BHW65_02005 [Verrucomicrobia bacterium CAG:312_58_20]|nr:MAG: hypothetical protein BHW65_02005 [Verrucomicrobia bacterium CAG:312_58_20]
MGAKAVYRLIILMLAALLAFAAAASYIGWRNMREENTELELGRLRLEEQKAALEAEKAYKQEYFSRLIYDEEFAARVIREKLGFAEPDEIIFRFEDSSPTASERLGDPAPKAATAPESQTPAERAARDGAPYLRATILDRIFSSAPAGAGGDGFETEGESTDAAPAETPAPEAGVAAPSANSPAAETERGYGGEIKAPSGPNPIIFRNI